MTTFLRLRRAALALVAAGLVTISCGGIVDPSKNQTETFSGTLEVGSQKTHTFSSSKNGEFSAKVVSLTPTSTALVGLAAVFATDQGACTGQTLQVNNFANTTTSALGGQIFSGKYCLTIFDVGTLQTTQTYTVTVSHP